MTRPMDDLTAQITTLAATLASPCDTQGAAHAALARHGHVNLHGVDDLWETISPYIEETDLRNIDRIRVAIYTTAPGTVLDARLGDHLTIRMTGVSHASPLPNTLARADITSLTGPTQTIVGRHLTWEQLTDTILGLQKEYRARRSSCLQALSTSGEQVANLKFELAEATSARQELILEANDLGVTRTEIAATGLISRQGVHGILRSPRET